MANQNKNPEKQPNLLVVLSDRRLNNARQQLKSVVLECYEIFGGTFTEEVLQECATIYKEYVEIKDK